MVKKHFILTFLVCFVLGIGFVLGGPPEPTPKPPPQKVYDIAITDMWLDEDCQLCAKFENKGNTSITKDIRGEIWVDGKFFLYTVLANFSLPPGQTYSWKGGSPFKLTGSHSVKMIIDSDNQIAESNETNNTMIKSFTCEAQLKPPIETRKPDLVVDTIKFSKVKDTVWGQNKPCVIFNVIIYVRNVGDAKAGPFKVLLEKKGLPLYPDFTIACETCEIDVPGLAAGETLELSPRQFNTCGVMQQYLFRATADSKNSVKEYKEDNNTRTANYPPLPISK